MPITEEQFRRIEGCFPTQRGNVKISNLDVLNAILYVVENGCKWRALPRRAVTFSLSPGQHHDALIIAEALRPS